MTWQSFWRVVTRHRELALGVTFVGAAGWELIEYLALERPNGNGPLPLTLHAFQVLLGLGITWAVVRAWQARTRQEEALARMVEKVVMAQEEERRRIAYELHDGIAQLIVSAKQHLDTCADVWPHESSRAAGELATGRDRLDRALVEIRRVLVALRPSAIATEGLVGALHRSLDEAAEEAGWTVSLRADVGPTPLPHVVETAVFRIFQEALANAARHADTPCVDVNLRRDGSWLVLDVRDQGRGFLVNGGQRRGLGLSSMQERARLLGGSCVVESAPRLGTHLVVRLPLENGHANGHR